MYNESLESRLLALLFATPACAIAAWVLSAPSQHWTAVLMAVATTAGALSPGWYSIGIARPSAIARFEIFPRLTSTALSAVLVLVTRTIWVYPTLLLMSTVIGVLLFGRYVAQMRLSDLRPRNAPGALWRMRSASTTVVVGGAFTSTPVLIAGAVVPVTVLAQYGSIDRIYRLGLIVITVFTNALQGWVSETASTVDRLTRRMQFALLLHLGLGVAGGLFLAVLGPFVTRFLFGSAVAADPIVSIWIGVAFLAVAVNSAAGRLVLIPRGGSRQVLVATMAGAVFGLTAMIVLGIWFGATGVACGFASSELTVLVVQIASITRYQPQRSPAGPSTDGEIGTT